MLLRTRLFFAEIITELCQNCGKFQKIAGGQRTFLNFPEVFEFIKTEFDKPGRGKKGGLASPDLESFLALLRPRSTLRLNRTRFPQPTLRRLTSAASEANPPSRPGAAKGRNSWCGFRLVLSGEWLGGWLGGWEGKLWIGQRANVLTNLQIIIIRLRTSKHQNVSTYRLYRRRFL